MQPSKKKIEWGYIIAGVLILIFVLSSNTVNSIMDWSTAELVGYNTWAVICIVIPLYLIYRGFRGKK